MSDFKSSNGYTVSMLEDGQVCLVKPVPGSALEHRMWMRPDEAEAIMEFLQREVDENQGPDDPLPTEMGRYRSLIEFEDGYRYFMLDENGQWSDIGNDRLAQYEELFPVQVKAYMPLIPVRAESVTAENILVDVFESGDLTAEQAGDIYHKYGVPISDGGFAVWVERVFGH